MAEGRNKQQNTLFFFAFSICPLTKDWRGRAGQGRAGDISWPRGPGGGQLRVFANGICAVDASTF